MDKNVRKVYHFLFWRLWWIVSRKDLGDSLYSLLSCTLCKCFCVNNMFLTSGLCGVCCTLFVHAFLIQCCGCGFLVPISHEAISSQQPHWHCVSFMYIFTTWTTQLQHEEKPRYSWRERFASTPAIWSYLISISHNHRLAAHICAQKNF